MAILGELTCLVTNVHWQAFPTANVYLPKLLLVSDSEITWSWQLQSGWHRSM